MRAQIASVEVFMASRITKTYTLLVARNEIRGRQHQGTIATSAAFDNLQVYCTADFINKQSLNMELVEAIRNHCQIENPAHLLLLTLALSASSLDQLQNTFAQHGLHVKARTRGGELL